MNDNNPTIAAIETAMTSLDAAEIAYTKTGEELKGARERLVSMLKVAQSTGAPIFVDKLEAARLLDVSESTINRLLKSHDLPSIKIMGAVRIRRSDIENFLGTKE